MSILVIDKSLYDSEPQFVTALILNLGKFFTMTDIKDITWEYDVCDEEIIADVLSDLCNYGYLLHKDNGFYNLFDKE